VRLADEEGHRQQASGYRSEKSILWRHVAHRLLSIAFLTMRILAAVALVFVLALQYRLWASESGMREVWRLKDEVAAQQGENEQLQERNRTLAAEVQDLKKGKVAIEERARTDLGMVGSNETFYQVMPDKTVVATDAQR
jgi:cell division protein FtsB